jgi:hypothetical protein
LVVQRHAVCDGAVTGILILTKQPPLLLTLIDRALTIVLAGPLAYDKRSESREWTHRLKVIEQEDQYDTGSRAIIREPA